MRTANNTWTVWHLANEVHSRCSGIMTWQCSVMTR